MKFSTKKQITIALVFLGAIVIAVWSLSPAALPLARWLGFKTIYPLPEQVKYPKYVHNPNTNLWAVQTGYGIALKDRSWHPQKQVLYYGLVIDTVWMGQGAEPYTNNYSSSQVAPGCEYRYLDSAGAVSFYTAFAKERDSLNAIEGQKALEEIRTQEIKDSIFKQEHTYQ